MVWELFAITESGVSLLTDAVVNSVPVVGRNERNRDHCGRTAGKVPERPLISAGWSRRAGSLSRRGEHAGRTKRHSGISRTASAATGPPLVTVIV